MGCEMRGSGCGVRIFWFLIADRYVASLTGRKIVCIHIAIDISSLTGRVRAGCVMRAAVFSYAIE